ncbi:uncharacterized protein LOC111902115 isoform X2 [Lactuca sativa]|uniref:uncharacterized protein LOC111902115 isoform X2 n=2 Tax=Lactuca sativa TaxID=4236 RepID=UPI0022B049EC|nr:uncharacterized protein LOC111902115 isoform X2 [Lactuca sativa]
MCRFLVCCLVCVIVLLSRLCDCVAVSPAAWSHSCHLPSPSRHSQKSASSVLQFGYTMLLEPVSGHTRPTHHPLVLLQKIPQRLLVTILEYLILQQERKCQKSQHHSLLIEPSGFNLVLNTHSTPITFLSLPKNHFVQVKSRCIFGKYQKVISYLLHEYHQLIHLL